MRTSAFFLAILCVLGLSAPPAAAAGIDVTGLVLANTSFPLIGDSVINLRISGKGTLTIAGSGTLVVTQDSDFTLPDGRQHQQVTTQGGNHPYTTVANADEPAIIVNRGATLQYGNGGATGSFRHLADNTPGYQVNILNIRVDGTLTLDASEQISPGIVSGVGLIQQPRSFWGTVNWGNTQPFAGTIDNGTGMNFGTTNLPLSFPNVHAILNQGSAIIDTPLNYTLLLRNDFYQRAYGSDINFHSRPGSKVVMTGVYGYADQGTDANPTLSSPALNYATIPHDLNARGINIENANVQWGDGTTTRFFLPAKQAQSYINMHKTSSLAFDYAAPVTLSIPISGGKYHDSLATPATNATVTIMKSTVTYAVKQNYHGATIVNPNATLQIGDATGNDSSLLTDPSDQITNNGTVKLRDTSQAAVIPSVSGDGVLDVAGPATVQGDLNLTDSGGLTVDLDAKNYSPLTVTGTTNAAGTLTLTPSQSAGTAPITLVKNTGPAKVVGTFTDMPEGTTIAVGARTYQITYKGGSGNDIVLNPHTAATNSAQSAPASNAASHSAADPSNIGLAQQTDIANAAATSSPSTWYLVIAAVLALIGLGCITMALLIYRTPGK
jgi:hypothetical protein